MVTTVSVVASLACARTAASSSTPTRALSWSPSFRLPSATRGTSQKRVRQGLYKSRDVCYYVFNRRQGAVTERAHVMTSDEIRAEIRDMLAMAAFWALMIVGFGAAYHILHALLK